MMGFLSLPGLRFLPALFLIICLPICQAQQPLVPLSPSARHLRERIESRSLGASLTVILKDRTEYHGELFSAGDQSFVLTEVDRRPPITIPYEDVRKVLSGYGGMNHATGQRVHRTRSIVIGVVVVAGLLVLVFAAASAR